MAGKELIVCAFEYAAGGAPVSFIEYTWATDPARAAALGRWFGSFHTLSQRFLIERHPRMLDTAAAALLQKDEEGKGESADNTTQSEKAATAQYKEVNTYATNLSGTLAGEPIDPRDRAQMRDVSHYGLLHGDVNVTNFFARTASSASSCDDAAGTNSTSCAALSNEKLYEPIMFDFDQTQLGWYAFDLSQPFWGLIVAIDANYGGGELPASITPTTFGDFGRALIGGYRETFRRVAAAATTSEDEGDIPSFDWAQLRRMIKLRRMQYANFCTRAVAELEGDETPASAMMKEFCGFIASYIAKEGNEARIDAMLEALSD